MSEQEFDIYMMAFSGFTIDQIAIEYNISVEEVQKIIQMLEI